MEKKVTIMEGPYTTTYNINRYHFSNELQKDLVKSKIHARNSKAYGKRIAKWEIEQAEYERQAMWDDITYDCKMDVIQSVRETTLELIEAGYDIEMPSKEMERKYLAS